LTEVSTPNSTTTTNDEEQTISPIASTSASAIASTSASPIASGSGSGIKRKTKSQTEAALKRQKKVEEEGFNLAGKHQSVPKKGRYENKTPGSIAVCAECGKKFTVSKVRILPC